MAGNGEGLERRRLRAGGRIPRSESNVEQGHSERRSAPASATQDPIALVTHPAIAAAARAAGKPHEVVTLALQQLAAKVAAGLEQPTVARAVAYVLAIRTGPGLARRDPEERQGVRYRRLDVGPTEVPPPREDTVAGARGVLAAVRTCSHQRTVAEMPPSPPAPLHANVFTHLALPRNSSATRSEGR